MVVLLIYLSPSFQFATDEDATVSTQDISDYNMSHWHPKSNWTITDNVNEEFQKFALTLHQICPDQRKWRENPSGEYSLKSMYIRLRMSETLYPLAKLIWKSFVPIKIEVPYVACLTKTNCLLMVILKKGFLPLQ